MYGSGQLHRSRQIAQNLFFYTWMGYGNNCNTTLFTNVLRGAHPHIIVDPGLIADEIGEQCFDSLAASIQDDGFRIEDVGLIINTHAHPDHCGANEAVVERSKKSENGKESEAIVTLTQEDDEYRQTLAKSLYSLLGMDPPQFEAFFYLQEGELTLGKQQALNLQVLHTPGHSPGSVCLYCPDTKVLITGDVVFFGSIGRTDFPGGSLATLMQSIEKLSSLDVEYILPGHSTEYGALIEGSDKVKRNFQAIKMMF